MLAVKDYNKFYNYDDMNYLRKLLNKENKILYKESKLSKIRRREINITCRV